ncbi:MAG: hypothetical protein SchgKO_07810 [Schleiferiaceae bacterium]
MKTSGLTAILLGMAATTFAQTQDTLRSEVLEEVTVKLAAKDPFVESTEDALKAMSGITLVNRGNYAKDPVYNGISGDRLQITLDGMRVFGACTDRMDPVTSYVERGNLSAVYPSAQLGGISGINLSFSQPSKKAFAGNVNAYANYGQQAAGYSVQGNGTQGNHAFLFQWSQRDHSNYTMPSGEALAHTGFQKINSRLKYAYSLENWVLSTDVIVDVANSVGYAGLPMDVSLAEAFIGKLSAENYSQSGKTEITLYGNSIYHQMDDSNRDVVVHMDMPGWSQTYGGYYSKLNYRDWGNWMLKAEAFTNFRRAEMTMYFPSERPMYMETWPDTRWNSALIFGNVTWDRNDFKHIFSSSIALQTMGVINDFGARQWEVFGYDDLERMDWIGQLDYQVQYRKNNYLLTGNVQIGNRAPSVSERFGFFLYNAQDGFDYLGNPDLKNEFLLSTSLAGKYIVDGWTLSLNVFANQYYDYIFGDSTSYSTMTIGANGVRQYQNSGTAFQTGLDVRVEKSFSNGIFLSSRSTVQYSALENGDAIPLTPPLVQDLTLGWKNNTWEARIDQVLVADQQRANTALNEMLTPGYQTTALALGYTRSLGGNSLRLEIGVNNLFNMNYVDALDWMPIIHPGRNYSISLNYSL